MKTVPEPHADLLEASDVHKDVVSLTAALEHRRVERQAYQILDRADVREMLNKLIAHGVSDNEEEVILRALRTLLIAVGG